MTFSTARIPQDLSATLILLAFVSGVFGAVVSDPVRVADPVPGRVTVATDSDRLPLAPPVAASNIAAKAFPDGRVELAWHLGHAQHAVITLERRTPGGEWQPIASLLPAGERVVEYEDTLVKPGHRYRYRLVPAGRTDGVGAVSVTVPRGRGARS